MYSKTSDHLRVNEARLDFFFKENQNLESIPPTENALLEHCKRAIYQCGIWSRCLETQQNLPNKSDFGWQRITDILTYHGGPFGLPMVRLTSL